MAVKAGTHTKTSVVWEGVGRCGLDRPSKPLPHHPSPLGVGGVGRRAMDWGGGVAREPQKTQRFLFAFQQKST